MSNSDALEVAHICHDLAVVLSAAAELLCERAGTILASVPMGGPHDRTRVAWAMELAADMESKGRHDEAERVLLAALAISEGLFGRDDPQSIEARRLLGGAPSGLGGGAPRQDGPRA